MRDTQRQLPAHQELLWACATARDDAGVRKALKAFGIDWPACARASIRHGMMPLMAHRLAAFTGDVLVPADVSACFARMLQANELRNRVMLRECARLLRGLEASGIRCLILKGVGLALTVYPQPALRNFA